MSGKKPPFSKNSEAYKRMIEMLESGEIGPETPPKEAHNMDPIFVANTELAQFRAGLNKAKTERGLMLRGAGSGGGMLF